MPSASADVPTGDRAQPAGQDQLGDPAAADSDTAALAPLTLTGVGLLAAGLLSAVATRRRRQKRSRRPNRAIRLPIGDAARAEAELTRAADPGGVEFLDLVLRSVAAHLAGAAAETMPDVVAARLGADDVELLLTAPAGGSAPGWVRVSEDGMRWQVPTTAALPVTAENAGEHLAPLPALVTVGHLPPADAAAGGGDVLLLDLERLGSLAINGDPAAVVGLLRFMAAEIGHNGWSDAAYVTLVGFGEELVELAPDRMRYRATAGEAIAALEQHVADVLNLVNTHEAGTVLAGRVDDIAGDAWMPEIVLLATPPTGEEKARLADLLDRLAGQPRAAAGLVLAGQVPAARWSATIDSGGLLDLPELGLQVSAQLLDAPTAQCIVDLVRQAEDGADVPIPAVPSAGGWSAPDCNAAGGRLETADVDQDAQTVPAPEPAVGVTVGYLAAAVPLPTPLAAPETVEADDGADKPEGPAGVPAAALSDAQIVPFRAVDPAREQLRAEVIARDSTLGEDLARWQDPDADVIRVRVLGLVAVESPHPAAPRRDFSTELVAYLACHPAGGATPDEMNLALYGDDPKTAKTQREFLSRIRNWLGKPAGRPPRLSAQSAEDGRYRLSDEVLLDWTLFRRLRARGEALDPAAGEPYLRAALELVTGRPFDNPRPRNYLWLTETRFDTHVEAAVIDVADHLAEYYLGRGQTTAARWAAAQARLVDDLGVYDQPYRSLMRAAHAEGKPAELRELADELMARRDSDDVSDLEPTTARLVRDLLPTR